MPYALIFLVSILDTSILAPLPPYESFLTKNQDKVKRNTLESIKPGDIVYAMVTRAKRGASFNMAVRPMCTDEPNFKLLHDYKIKVSFFWISGSYGDEAMQ